MPFGENMSAPGGQNFQPESVAELSRFVQYMFAGFEKQLNESVRQQSDATVKLERQIAEISAKFERNVVTKEQHREDLDDLKDELREQKQELEDYQNKLSSYGRWFVSSLVLPLVGLIITIYGLLNGSN
jgi:predicted RNase H-like nuclease (RuvC/YqgF family)